MKLLHGRREEPGNKAVTAVGHIHCMCEILIGRMRQDSKRYMYMYIGE